MHCLFCGKTLPVLKRLQKQEFCSEAHRQQHDRLAVARLLEPKQEPEPAAADFVAEKVGAAAWVAEPLARAGALFWCAAVCLPGFDFTSAPPVPPVAPPVVGRLTALPGRREWLPAERDWRSQKAFAFPGWVARADLHSFQQAGFFDASLILGLEAWPEPGPLRLVATKLQEAPAKAWRSPAKPWRARLAVGRVHRERAQSQGNTPAASFAREVLRPAQRAAETLAGGGERLPSAAILLPALQATNTRPAPPRAPLFAVPADALRESMSVRGPVTVWRGKPDVALFADVGAPEAGPGQHGFLLLTAAAEPRDIAACPQLFSHKCWDVRVATQRLRFQPLEFVAAPLPAPRLGLRVRVRNRWRTTRAPLRVALLALPLIGTGLAMLPREKQIIDEKIGPWLRERSAIVLEDDFRSGLSSWGGGSGWAREWRYDQAGFIQTGRLGLLSASVPLSDYRLEFVGQIQKKSLGWVFRASDLRNFYAMKITISKPGPLPLGDIVRYVMVNGVETDRVELPLPISIRNDMLYRVETEAVEDRFSTSVNGQVVDTFRDGRHPTGGVGLFSDPGEAARVLHVRVADRDDLVGRICAYLSGIPPKVKGQTRR